jgi:hypothetical protein
MVRSSPPWADLLAGADPKVVGQRLQALGAHLCLCHPDATRRQVRIELIGSAAGLFARLEERLGMFGLAARAQAVPVDRVLALRLAVGEARAGFYPDPVGFVGEALERRPALVVMIRGLVRLLDLGGAAVAPSAPGGAVCLVGRAVGPDAVASLVAFGARLPP